MKAYRLTVNLKLGLIVFAVVIAVASLWYTNYLVDRLRERERASVRIWAGANEQVIKAPTNAYRPQFEELDAFLQRLASRPGAAAGSDSAEIASFRDAVAWARTMPPDDQLTFISGIIIDHITVPAIITDSVGRPLSWRNVRVADTSAVSTADSLRLVRRAAEMDDVYAPIPIEIDYGDQRLMQYVHYDESRLIKELRVYPWLQLAFVTLFILVGYLSFSYVRRSEQSSLWVGMAREAAHQLGTPISSLMGWVELLRINPLTDEQATAVDEIEKDTQRLSRVASRFSDIGSLPKLEIMQLAPVVTSTADYMRRRFPQHGKQVDLKVHVPTSLHAPINPELFEWVVENLLKNALDAIEQRTGLIEVNAHQEDGTICIDVRDTGKGIDRRQWGNVFRPGYSTKKRGWGLGLSLAKRIVEDYHGGSLSVAGSKVGHGTTFRIELPSA